MRQLLYVILAAFVAAAVIGLGKLLYQKRMAGIFGNQRTLISFFSDDFNWIFYCSLGVCH